MAEMLMGVHIHTHTHTQGNLINGKISINSALLMINRKDR